MKILIVGGGVAGPALARFLKDDADITLIDKAPKWGNIGYAITLWGNGRQILSELGIDHNVLKASYEIPWSAFEDKKGKLLNVALFDIFHPYGPTAVVTRTDLQQALVKDLEKNIKIKMGTTVASLVDEGDLVTVTFSDGSRDKFDLVVGADGIRSQIRDMVFGKNFLKYYGWTVYAFWLPRQISSPLGAIEFSGGGKICFLYPLEDKSAVNLMVADNVGKEFLDKNEKSREVLHEVFADFKDLVGHMIDDIEDPEHIFKDKLAYIDMENWYKGRVVLMGDAQHAISPLMGMGSSMALEDAYVLSLELKKSNFADVPEALERYSKRRSRRIKKFHKTSNFLEGFMMVKSPILSVFRDLLLEILPISFFSKKFEKVLAEKI